MNGNDQGQHKRDYLAIPIETQKCEIHIKKYERLSTLEKFTLKFINKEKSLKSLLGAFNAGVHVMNLIIAKLLYRDLIRLNLSEGTVDLTKTILPYVENDTLDNFLEQPKFQKSFIKSFIQEKISGEIFLMDDIKEFLKNPNPEITEYHDLKADMLDTYPKLKEYSIMKFAKCAKNDIKSELEFIDKLLFRDTLPYKRLYIPLTIKDGNKYLQLDSEIFPRHTQKAWRNALESQNEGEQEISFQFQLMEDESTLFSTDEVKNRAFEVLNSIRDLINIYITQRPTSRDRIEYLNRYDELYTKLIGLIDLIEERVLSINKISFHYPNSIELKTTLTELSGSAKDFVIISSDKLSSESIAFFAPLFDELIKKKIHVLLLWGTMESEEYSSMLSKANSFEKDLTSRLNNKLAKDFLHIIQSKARLNTNFILLDGETLLYSNHSFLNWNYEQDLLIPNLKIEGGSIPLQFLMFTINYIPRRIPARIMLETCLTELDSTLKKKIVDYRLRYILNLKDKLNRLDSTIRDNNFNRAIDFINHLKSAIGGLFQFDTVATIMDLGHEELLLDLIKPYNSSLFLSTDEIDYQAIGPNFKKNLSNLTRFTFTLITNDYFITSENEPGWIRGLNELHRISRDYQNLRIEQIRKNFNLNIYLRENNLFIYSNYRFLVSRPRHHPDYASKKVGLIINSHEINQKIRKFILN